MQQRNTSQQPDVFRCSISLAREPIVNSRVPSRDRPRPPLDQFAGELSLQRALAACERASAIFFITSRHEISRYPPSSGNAGVPATAPEFALDWTRLLIVGSECKSALEQAWAGKEVLLPSAWHA